MIRLFHPRWAIALSLHLLVSGSLAAFSAPHEITSLDFEWRFHRGDFPLSTWEDPSTGSSALATSPISPTHDDSAWRLVDVPHDYIVEGALMRRQMRSMHHFQWSLPGIVKESGFRLPRKAAGYGLSSMVFTGIAACG